MAWRAQSAFAPPGASSLPVAEESSSPTAFPLASRSTLKYFRSRDSFAGISDMCGTRREPGSGGRFLKKPPAQPTADLERPCRIFSSSRITETVQPEQETSVPCEKFNVVFRKSGRDRHRVPLQKEKRPEGHHTLKPLTSISVATRPKAASTVDASIHQRRPGAMNLLQSRDALATPLEDIHGISIA
jgi:hypothetical protein